MSAILHFLVNIALMINFFEAPIIPGVAYCQGLVYIIHSLQNTSKQIQRNTYNWCLEHNHISLFLIYLYHIWLYCVCTNLDEVPVVYLYVCFISIVENAIENKSIDNNEANPYEWNARVQEKNTTHIKSVVCAGTCVMISWLWVCGVPWRLHAE